MRQNSGHTAPDAIQRIYETVLDSGHWPTALDAVASLFGEAKATIIVSDLTNNENAFVKVSNNFDLDKLHDYSTRFSDIEAMAWSVVSRNGVGKVTTEHDFFDGDYDNHPSTVFLEEQLGVVHRNAVLYRCLPDWAESLSLVTPRQQGLLNPADCERLCEISTHLALASRIARPFNRLKERYGAVLALLDRLAVGVMLLDRRGRVVQSNVAMQEVLDLSAEMSVSRSGSLIFRNAPLDQAFRALMASAERTLGGDGAPPGLGSMSLRDSDQVAVTLELVPLIDNSGDLDGRFAGFALLAMAPTLAPSLPAGQLGGLFSLSAAESQVCDLLVAGRPTREIAERRSTSLETTRNQVKSVLQKTGSPDRSNLVRLAFDYAIPLRSDPD
ncbi:MAG: hypothetical protein H6898_07555 [Rhodobacter sp.]|nr:hypothetical protein [Rhodobacter sp.]